MKDAADMKHTKKRSDEEVAIKRWENEGGEIPTTAESPSVALERRENEGGESQHTDTALLVTMINTSRAVERRGEPRATEREIDLCLMPRPERHPLVFAAFDRLAVGESVVLVNDHDPQPLRIQIERMREGEMSWEYIERGAGRFRIRITRTAPAAGGQAR